MTGTFINVVAVIAGSLAGTLLGDRLPERMRQTVMDGLGLATMMMGIKMAYGTTNILYVIGSVLLGGLAGEAMDLDSRLNRLGRKVQDFVFSLVNRRKRRHTPELAASSTVLADSEPADTTFARGMVAATLLFCVGPMAILGSIQDGLTGDYSTLAVKSTLDAFASLAFSSTMGIGVAFSTLPLLLYQGCLTLGARFFQGILTEAMIQELTATGGILIFAIGLGLLEIKQVRVANLLPAIFISPVIYYIISIM